MTPTPLANWDDNESQHELLVWWTRLDKRFQIEVQRTAEATALLCIFDHGNDDALIHQEEVTLAYGARFGPDVSDVHLWQNTCVKVVDAL